MSSRSRLLLDLGMFAAMLAAFNPVLTGIAIHEWLSLALFVALLFHTIINWEWTLRVMDSFAEKILSASRVNLVVDIALFVATVTVMLSGLMVSQAIAASLGVSIAPDSLWVAVHAVSADAVMLLLFAHFALHWRWVARTVRGFGSPRTAAQPRPVPRPAYQAATSPVPRSGAAARR